MKMKQKNTTEKTKKQSKGITLIALVITIVVLLILASVTIATLTGDNGLLTKTSEAQFRTEIAQYKEELDLSIINDEAEHKGKRTDKFNETEYSKIKKLIPSFNKKYENILVVEEDKLVYKGNDKTLYLRAKEMGMLSENDLLDDEILEELQPFITEWTVEAGDSITLPLYNHYSEYNFTVDYGDGTGEFTVTSSSDEDKIHIYEQSGKYRVIIKGICSFFGFSYDATSKDKISGIVQWGNVFHHSGNKPSSGFNGAEFTSCKNLTGEIPEPSKNSFVNFTNTWNGMFCGCTGLVCSIPEKFFINVPTAVTNGTFNGCSGITGSISEGLFKNCPNVLSFKATFSGCNKLTGSIPEDLFKNCPNVSNFNSTFYGCSGITGNIPEGLFKNCPKVTDFGSTFSGCSRLTGSIPESIFKNCPNVKSFHSTFRGCSEIIGNIPEKLFENCADVESFYGTFWRL